MYVDTYVLRMYNFRYVLTWSFHSLDMTGLNWGMHMHKVFNIHTCLTVWEWQDLAVEISSDSSSNDKPVIRSSEKVPCNHNRRTISV